jgi:ribosome-binding factor A
MAREFSRTERLGSQLQRELSTLLRNEIKDPRLGMVTVQEVRVVRDLSHAKVFFTVMGGELDTKASARMLNDAAAFLRRELGHLLKIRSVPQLHFVHDESIERGSRLSALIEEAVESDASKHSS